MPCTSTSADAKLIKNQKVSPPNQNQQPKTMKKSSEITFMSRQFGATGKENGTVSTDTLNHAIVKPVSIDTNLNEAAIGNCMLMS